MKSGLVANLRRSVVFGIFASFATADDKTVKVPVVGEFSDVEFTRIEGEKVCFSHKDGAGKILISSLPKDVQDKLKSLPKVDMMAKAAAEFAHKEAELHKAFKQDAGGMISGEIVQVLDDGVLMTRGLWTPNKAVAEKTVEYEQQYILGSANFGRSAEYSEVPVEKIKMVRETKRVGQNTVFHVKCSTDKLYVGATLRVEAFPCGTYSYTSVQNASMTVQAFTSDLDSALAWLLEKPSAEPANASKPKQ